MLDKTRAALAGLALAGSMVEQQALSPSEKKLARSIEVRLEEEIACLRTVIDIDSSTFNRAGIRKVGAYSSGSSRVSVSATDWVSLPEPVQRAGHLVAEHVAQRPEGKRVLLMGHLDTIFEGPGHRFERAGNIIRGAGAADMKGGDVVILYALKALRDGRGNPRARDDPSRADGRRREPGTSRRRLAAGSAGSWPANPKSR